MRFEYFICAGGPMGTIPGICKTALDYGSRTLELPHLLDASWTSLGKLDPTVQQVRIRVDLNQPSVVAFVVDGKKNPSLLSIRETPDGVRHVRKRVSVHGIPTETPYTKYPENHLRIGEITESRIRIWELAIVSQNGWFFFTSQNTFDLTLRPMPIQSGRRLCFEQDRLKAWPQMMEFLEKLLGKPLFALKESEEGKTPTPPGTVLWWNFAQGLGAIQTAKGAARAHWSQVVKGNRKFRYLVKGERVSCELAPIPQPTQDGNIRPTAFEREAKNIKPRT